ncbi:alkane 1-monooxygenase [Fertoebacter nigrum]|uniref:Alkane 1-monooxygenase n=1 Tax=Fertoeibacter niger TaxID=2656921 RepID=A0A8X8KMH1_9RHOB|nr:alkane 1-monooxygenase [Fertoeibacter niger]NUB43910.1 alkane 1-monooxygenase [Fertoeibacter niger]
MTPALFPLATLAPLPLLALGVGFGGALAFAGLVYMTLFALLLDQVVARAAAPDGVEFPAADALLVVLALAHLLALPLAVWAIGGPSGLSAVDRVALFAGFGLFFGQVSNPVAHELIHRGDRRLFRLGRLVYVTLLFGHHTSAHRLVHHRHAASRDDPNTARSGEGFYRFALRAWVGSFRKGLAAENDLRRRGAKGLHPYAIYTGGAVLSLLLGWVIAGPAGALVWAGLAAHAQSQLLLSDYVQHYGLMRRTGPDGRLEPVGDRHSWNAPHGFTAALMLNAPRHSDHHAHPARPYPALRLPVPDLAPRLPWSLPVSCVVALLPPLWRRAMRPRLAQWRAEEAALAQP